MNIASLSYFIQDHPEITSKFRIVIHIEEKSKPNEILIKEFQQDQVLSKSPIKTMIFVGHPEKSSSTKDAKQYFQENIFSTPLSHKSSELLMYSNSKFEILDFCLPAKPVFALRMFQIQLLVWLIPFFSPANLWRKRPILYQTCFGPRMPKFQSRST